MRKISEACKNCSCSGNTIGQCLAVCYRPIKLIEEHEKGGLKPIVYGEWSDQMLFRDGFGGARVGYICSKCKKYVPFAGKFCGNCGATMINGRSYEE